MHLVKTALAAIAAGLFIASAVAKPRPPAPPPTPVLTISQSAGDWSYYATTKTDPISSLSPAGWQFQFPVWTSSTPCYSRPNQCGRVGYVTTRFNGLLQTGMTVTMSFNITGLNPTFGYQTESFNTCGGPANVRLYIERAGNTNSGSQPYHRWWSNPQGSVLQAGQQTLTVQFDPSKWSSVFGEFGNSSAAAETGFLEALANMGRIGMTFGGGCFFGHGVYQTSAGVSTFQMLSYTAH